MIISFELSDGREGEIRITENGTWHDFGSTRVREDLIDWEPLKGCNDLSDLEHEVVLDHCLDAYSKGSDFVEIDLEEYTE